MQQHVRRMLMLSGAALIACSTPTGMVCACPPSRSILAVVGTVRDAGDAPVAGARVYFDAVPAGIPESSRFYTPLGVAQTDAAGAFGSLLYNLFGSAQELRANVVRAGSTDTLRFNLGAFAFRSERERPDTLRTTIRLP